MKSSPILMRSLNHFSQNFENTGTSSHIPNIFWSILIIWSIRCSVLLIGPPLLHFLFPFQSWSPKMFYPRMDIIQTELFLLKSISLPRFFYWYLLIKKIFETLSSINIFHPYLTIFTWIEPGGIRKDTDWYSLRTYSYQFFSR